MSQFMKIDYSRRAECEEHWAQVRAGMHEPDAHVFKDDISHLIELERFKARKAIEAAAAHMRHAEQLAGVRQ